MYGSFNELMQAAERREVDLLASLGVNARRTQFLEYTLGATPMVSALFGRMGSVGAEEGLDLETARYALEGGNISNDYVQRRYPNAHIVTVEGTLEALAKVSLGGADF